MKHITGRLLVVFTYSVLFYVSLALVFNVTYASPLESNIELGGSPSIDDSKKVVGEQDIRQEKITSQRLVVDEPKIVSLSKATGVFFDITGDGGGQQPPWLPSPEDTKTFDPTVEANYDQVVAEMFKVNMDSESPIGQGFYSWVRSATDVNNNRIAVKETRVKLEGYEKTMDMTYAEIMAAETLKDCPNVIKLLGHGMVNNRVYMMMELGEKSLEKLLLPLAEHDAKAIFRDIVSGVKCMHDHGIAHLDIKVENFVIFNTGKLAQSHAEETCHTVVKDQDNDFVGQIKVVDLASCLHFPRDDMDYTITIPRGTFENSSPRNLAVRMHHLKPPGGGDDFSPPLLGYNPRKQDSFALGVTLFKLVTGKLPWQVNVPNNIGGTWKDAAWERCRLLIESQKDGIPWPSDHHFSSNLVDLIGKMLEPEEDKRIWVEDILEHSWLQGTCHKDDDDV